MYFISDDLVALLHSAFIPSKLCLLSVGHYPHHKIGLPQ